MLRMDFSWKVLELTGRIPSGKVTTYGEIARALGNARLSRAVGNALHGNPRPVETPCHRVVKSDGSLGGYSRGIHEKTKLLRSEGVQIQNNRILNFHKLFFKLTP